MNKPMIVGVAGGTGSGKTTLAEHIAAAFGENVTVIAHDSYYHLQVGKTYEERCLTNYDHPDAFETDLLRAHLDALCRGQSVDVPVYDYTVHNRSDKVVTVHPTPLIVLEGILIFSDASLRNMMDLRVFVDTDADERILRRILRDTKERARSLDSVISQYLTTVKPMHEAFVEPSKKHADIIIPEGGKNPVAYNMLITEIEKHLKA
jgi:uridine kinase